MSAAAKRVATEDDSVPKKKARPKAAPTPVVNLPAPETLEPTKPKGPYPEGVQVFSYTPESGGDPILLPVNGFERPNKLWLFDISQLPIIAQTWKWMDKANVPKGIQRQAQFLDDAEYFQMFDGWFDAMKAGPKGAVTSGK